MVELKNKKTTTIAALFFSVIILLSCVVVYQATSHEVNEQFLGLSVSPEGETFKLGVNETKTFTAQALNGTAPYTFSWEINPSANLTLEVNEETLQLTTKLVVESESLTLCYPEATEDFVTITLSGTDKDGLTGQAAPFIVADPYESPGYHFDGSTATAKYIVQADGLGWFRVIKGLDGSVISDWTSLNPTITIEYAMSKGGLVYITDGNYTGAVLDVPGDVFLVADPGVSGIKYQSIADGAKIDEPTFNTCFGAYKSGSLTLVRGSSAVSTSATWYLAFKSDNSICYQNTNKASFLADVTYGCSDKDDILADLGVLGSGKTVCVVGVANEALSAGEVVYPIFSTGKYALANASTSETIGYGQLYLNCFDVTLDEQCLLVEKGYFTLSTWSWPVDVPLWVGTTPGLLVEDDPEIEDVNTGNIAVTVSSTEIYFASPQNFFLDNVSLQSINSLPVLWYDGFESGALCAADTPSGKWDYNETTGASTTLIDTTKFYSGETSFKSVTTAADQWSNIVVSIPTSETLYIGGWVNLDNLPSVFNDIQYLFLAKEDAANKVAVHIYNDNGIMVWQLWDGTSNNNFYCTTNPEPDDWIWVELKICKGTTIGELGLSINGEPVIDLTEIEFLSDINVLCVGQGWSTEAATVNFDEVTVSSEPIGVPDTKTNGVISITFDDGLAGVYTNGLPLLQAKNMPATHYIVSSFIYDYSGNPNYMTLAQLTALQAANHEIACHSATHPFFTELSEAQIISECTTCQSLLRTNGLLANNFAYPFGARNDTTDGIVSSYFYTARTAYEDLTYNSLPYSSDFAVQAFYGETGNSTTCLPRLKQYVDFVRANDLWGVIFFHDVVDSPVTEYQISTADFAAFLDYLEFTGVTVRTVEEVRTSV